MSTTKLPRITRHRDGDISLRFRYYDVRELTHALGLAQSCHESYAHKSTDPDISRQLAAEIRELRLAIELAAGLITQEDICR